ncbi:unnamed protein product [Rotaria sordida]|uniref:Nuclear receptor domain-containing protein n=1 Tax=Rotaria sordida TaxID=392033 RepID=A0A814PNY8_9BILA|nr:unnamed protein product [Rotaria sordida]
MKYDLEPNRSIEAFYIKTSDIDNTSKKTLEPQRLQISKKLWIDGIQSKHQFSPLGIEYGGATTSCTNNALVLLMLTGIEKPKSLDNINIITRQGRNTSKPGFCLICNAEARIFNYAVLSCYSCKTFFRRHSFHLKNIRPCQYGGDCEITVQTRKYCTSCRLAKCFAKGMSTELIRKEYQRSKCSPSIKSNKKSMSILPITSLNLLNNDQSYLKSSEWNLLSNVVHAFDKFNLVPSMRNIVKSLDFVEPPIKIDISDTFNLFASFYTSVKSFVSVTADFRVLTVAEQRSLFQRNLHGLFNLCGTFMLRDAGIFDNIRNESIIAPLYGHEIVRQAKQITMRLDFDSTIVKIIHMVFAFSTNCYTVNYDPYMSTDALLKGTFRLLGSQNVYTEMLWKYMVYRYGYDETIRRFAALIKQILDLIVLSADIYMDNRYHQILVDDFVEEAKTALILNEKDSIPLWGKDNYFDY